MSAELSLSNYKLELKLAPGSCCWLQRKLFWHQRKGSIQAGMQENSARWFLNDCILLFTEKITALKVMNSFVQNNIKNCSFWTRDFTLFSSVLMCINGRRTIKYKNFHSFNIIAVKMNCGINKVSCLKSNESQWITKVRVSLQKVRAWQLKLSNMYES